MFLKFRYRLGYESVCAEVADSISWRRFARIGIDGRVPHPTTLMKITTRCGSEVIEQLNEALLAKAAGAKLLRVGKCGPTPPWYRPTLTTPPTRVCWPRRCGASPDRDTGQSRRRGHPHALPGPQPCSRAARPADRLETAAARR
jgi:IS5 family transposase